MPSWDCSFPRSNYILSSAHQCLQSSGVGQESCIHIVPSILKSLGSSSPWLWGVVKGEWRRKAVSSLMGELRGHPSDIWECFQGPHCPNLQPTLVASPRVYFFLLLLPWQSHSSIRQSNFSQIVRAPSVCK